MFFDKCAELLPRWAFDLETGLVELILNIWTLQYNINLTLEPPNDRIGCVCWTEERKPRRSRGLGTDGPIFHCAGFAFELRGGALRAHRDRRRALAIEDCGQLDCCFASQGFIDIANRCRPRRPLHCFQLRDRASFVGCGGRLMPVCKPWLRAGDYHRPDRPLDICQRSYRDVHNQSLP